MAVPTTREIEAAEIQTKLEHRSLGLEERKMDLREKRARSRQLNRRILGLAITLGFFGTIGLLVFGDVPDGSRDGLMLMIGVLGTSFAGVGAFLFSSQESAEETHRSS